MVFPFINFKKKKKTADFLIMLVYYHKYGNDVSRDESEKIAEFYKNSVSKIIEKLPKNITLIDIAIPVKTVAKLDVHFFPLSNIETDNEDFKKITTALKNVLKKQIERSEINNPFEFFEYEA